MKTKVIILKVLMLVATSLTAQTPTAAVSDIATQGVGLTPEIAGKLARIELIKLEKYAVLDQFDMNSSLEGDRNWNNCFGKSCLINMGKELGVAYMLSGSIDRLGPKIVISLKLIDVNEGRIQKSRTMEFEDHPDEIQRMMQIVLLEMYEMDVPEETKKRLAYKHELITSTNVGKVSNSGPRFGMSVVGTPELMDFMTRKKRDGGLESLPVMTNLGYQFEVQYVGTENFSALFEIIPNIAGVEQGNFIPTLSFLNGFRFGQSGWEFAFGPSFGARRIATGIDVEGDWMTQREYESYHYENWSNDPANFDINGNVINPYEMPEVDYQKRLDTRGDLEFNTNWLMAFGRTFRAGSLNIPVNIYYSGNKFGGVFGTSVGFNIIKSKSSINPKNYSSNQSKKH